MNAFFERKGLKYAMVGSGSWATAIVTLLLNNHEKVGWYIRDRKGIEHIRKHSHPMKYLQTVYLDPSRLDMSDDIDEVVGSADVIVFCVPSAFFLAEMENLKVSLEGKFIISAIKGFVSSDNITIAEYFNRMKGVPYDRIGVISGPTHAEEVAMGRLSYLTLTSKHIEISEALGKVFACSYIKTRTCTDIYGVEYAAALKNIYAIAAGIAHGMGLGDNFLAVLATNAYRELCSFLEKTHPARFRNTDTSAYLGDLLVTSYSQFSRNRTFGNMLGKGYSVKSAQMEMNMVAEGYYASRCLHEICGTMDMVMPVAETVYRVLYAGCDVRSEMNSLTECLI